MNNFEVEEPILNTPYEEPALHWLIEEGRPPEKKQGRRQAGYFYRDPKAPVSSGEHEARGQWVGLSLVNQIREQMKDWRRKNYPGATGTTMELLEYWQREGRQHRLVFELARDLARDYTKQPGCTIPVHVLFPQIAKIVEKYLNEKVRPIPPANILDVFLSPYYGWVIERLVEAIKPDTSQGEAPEIPRYEKSRGPGSTAEVDFWTSRDVREAIHSHVNYVVADTKKWEQAAAHSIDKHEQVDAFAKNAGLGFAIPYMHNGQLHDYMSDFIIRLKGEPLIHLILETKWFDELAEVKSQAARRWTAAVNAEGSYGLWKYAVARKPEEVGKRIDEAVK